MLHCSRCGEDKPGEEFSPQPSNGKRGRSQWCRPCNAAYVRERNQDPARRAARAEYARRRRADPAVKQRSAQYDLRYHAERPEVRQRQSRSVQKQDAQRAYAASPEGKLRIRLKAQRRRAIRRSAIGPDPVTPEKWQARVDEFLGLCAYCLQARPLTIDHLQPLSQGGLDDMNNVVPACGSCNSRKGARSLLSFATVL